MEKLKPNAIHQIDTAGLYIFPLLLEYAHE